MKLTTEVLDKLFPIFVTHEGNIPHMYLDTRGYVTIGVGFMLPDDRSARRLSYTTNPLPIQVLNEYTALKRLPAGKVASWYAPFTKLRMSESAIKAEFNVRMQAMADALSKAYQLESFPEPAQIAILDMAYNLGAGALTRGWPNFRAACNAGDWETAAKESSRRGVPEARNAETFRLLMSAAGK